MFRSIGKFVLLSLLALQVSLPLGSDVALAASFDVTTPAAQAVSHSVFSPEEFLAETNAARRAVNLPELVLNDTLTTAAEAKAQDMIANHYWAHFRPSDGKAPWAFIEEAGYQYKVAGENLARGYRTPAGITKAWLASPTHRANLLSPKYQEVGFACVRTTDEEGNTVLITVQLFGTPQ